MKTIPVPGIDVSFALYVFDRSQRADGSGCIVGIDEAGRGPLAGPVVAAAVVLDLDAPIPGINDSKKLSAPARERLYDAITASAPAWGVGQASVEEIERINILQATFLAMRRSLASVSVPWALALVDGNHPIPGQSPATQKAIVKGDATSASIAAASIIAKVTRDRIMLEYHRRFPQYGFSENKGYATAYHRDAIVEHGLCEIHRRSFCTDIFLQTRLEL